jgi:hypothetical protein
MEEEIRRAYRDLERRMKALAESDGHVYLPNPEPTARVDYILICMEPSLGHWARSAEEARAKVASGFRNFLADIEPMLFAFSVRRFLCEKGQRYLITDFSKGAMLGKHAGAVRADRYDRWYALLQEEIDLLAAPGACVIAVGKAVAEHLRRREFPREVTPVIHYSPLAGRARTVRLEGHEDRFREFVLDEPTTLPIRRSRSAWFRTFDVALGALDFLADGPLDRAAATEKPPRLSPWTCSREPLWRLLVRG